MTERRRLPKKRTSPEWWATHDRNVSFEWAALKCTCNTSPVKRAFICSFSTRANPARRQ